MLIDTRLEFSNKQAVAAAGAVSTNVLPVAANAGAGRPLFVIVQFDAALAGALVISLQSAADAAMSGATAIATLNVPISPAGTRVLLGLPLQSGTFLRLNYSAACTVSAFLSDQEPASWAAYKAVV